MFDLIIGTETMECLGIALDFKTEIITLDEMNLPMRNIKNLQSRYAQYQIWADSFYTKHVITYEATKQTLKILDTIY